MNFRTTTFKMNLFFLFVKKATTVVVTILLGLLIGKTICTGSYSPYVILFIILWSFLYIKHKDLLFFLALAVITNTLSIYNPDFLRVQGLFKLRDLLLISLLIPVFYEILVKKGMDGILKSPISKAIFFYWSIIIIIGLYTIFAYRTSINLVVRSARMYLYYAIFFAVPFYLSDKKRFTFILKLTIATSLIFTILYIIQAFLPKYKLFLAPVMFCPQKVEGYTFVRSYVSSGFSGIVFWPLLAFISIVKRRSLKILSISAVVLWTIVFLISMRRTSYYLLPIGMIITGLLLPATKRKLFFKEIIILFSIIFIALMIVSFLAFGSKTAIFDIVSVRAQSGIEALITHSGTWGYRLNILARNWKYAVNNPLAGAGLVHPRMHLFENLPGGTIASGDTALATILGTTGFLGLIALLILSATFFRRSLYVLRNVSNEFYKAITIGFIVTYIIMLLTLPTGNSFIEHQSITNVALMLGLIEVIYMLDCKQKLNKKGANNGFIDRSS